MLFLVFLCQLLVCLLFPAAEQINAGGDDCYGNNGSRKLVKDGGKKIPQKAGEQPVQDIRHIIPQDGNAEYDQKYGGDSAVLFNGAVSSDKLIQMKDVCILHGIEVIF